MLCMSGRKWDWSTDDGGCERLAACCWRSDPSQTPNQTSGAMLHPPTHPHTAFDPKLIVFQMVAMQVRKTSIETLPLSTNPLLFTTTTNPNKQCLFYLVQGGILQGFHLLFGTDVSLAQVFTPKGLEVESAEGLLNVVAVLLSFVAGCVCVCFCARVCAVVSLGAFR